VLAYLLNPVAQKIERGGLNRLVATLLILAIVAIAVTVLLILLIPVIVRELAYFIESFPL
jgi:predicted PurR-regulated permease PerM